MKTFGKLYRGYEKATHRPIWAMELEPHVALRAKRVFPSIDKTAQGRLVVFETLEVCRELEWFMERFPLEMSDADRAALEKRAGEHRDRESLVENMIQGLHKPRAFKLALEPRDYQRSAADLALTTRGLLLADDVGLGKTCSSICVLSDPNTRPALVVTMTHLTRQWKRELGKFAPALNVHVLKTTTPYHLGEMKNGQRSLPGMFPDVIIGTYSKLAGWAGTLAPLLKSVIWDEVQELRTGEGTPNNPIAKGVAAAYIADRVEYRMGLSATPIYNYGCEIWTVLRYCAPGALGSWKEFLTEWGGESDGRGKSKLKNPKAFGTYARASGFMLRRTRTEVGRELPEVVRVPHEIECDTKPLEEITGAAEKLARIILAKHEEQRGDKRDASSKLDVLVRRATGVAKAPYVAEFVRLLVESGEQVVLYGWHRDCFARGTRVLMHDGTTKAIEDVRVGDTVMGPDSKPRNVLKLIRGRGPMFRVTPTKGDPWVCSGGHLLSLRCKAKNRRPLATIAARDFAGMSKRAQRDLTLYRSGAIAFQGAAVVEPWLLGYWLGDGVSRLDGLRISSADPEVADEARSIAERHGLSITELRAGPGRCRFYHFSSGPSSGGWHRNPLLNAFKALGLHRNKHIPQSYKTASVAERQELLAGLLDSDGHVQRGNAAGTAEFSNKERRLAVDVAFVARSLGLAAYVHSERKRTPYGPRVETYYRVSISGDLTAIPTRIARKRAPIRRNRKDVLNVGLQLDALEEGRFYGFECDGDHLFLLEDFTVVHNCYAIWNERLAAAGVATTMYTGTESPAQKDHARATFLSGDARVLIMSLRSGAGLDGLQDVARTVVFGELDWSPGVHEQCIGRVHRDGQASGVVAYFLVCDEGSDVVMRDVLQIKRAQAEGVRNPTQDLIEKLDVSGDRIRELARVYLDRPRAPSGAAVHSFSEARARAREGATP